MGSYMLGLNLCIGEDLTSLKSPYGKYKFHDALALEFNTYKAILKAIKKNVRKGLITDS